jgi:hypothetical protein
MYRWLHKAERPAFFIEFGGQWRVSVPRLEQYLHGRELPE